MNWFKSFWKKLVPSTPAPNSAEPTHNFTPHAAQMLASARKESERLNHNFIGTEHALLGLLALDKGIAVNLLKNYSLDLKTARQEVVKEVGIGPDQKPLSKPPYTPRLKKVLALSMREANALNHSHVGPEHILLGLLREGDGVAARIIRKQNIEFQSVRNEIMKDLGQISSAGIDAQKPPEHPQV
jgi:ATP-dependent Clp protease ATP-binding subunit ClpC